MVGLVSGKVRDPQKDRHPNREILGPGDHPSECISVGELKSFLEGKPNKALVTFTALEKQSILRDCCHVVYDPEAEDYPCGRIMLGE